MHKEAKKELRVIYKQFILDYAHDFGVTETCREFKVARATFYAWKKRYDEEGRDGLYRKKPVANSHSRKTRPEVIEKILELRKEYKLGALRITYYLERYHGIKISESTVSRTLKAHGVNRLPKSAPRRPLKQ